MYISRCVKSFAVYDIATVTMLTFVVNFANMSVKFRVFESDIVYLGEGGLFSWTSFVLFFFIMKYYFCYVYFLLNVVEERSLAGFVFKIT